MDSHQLKQDIAHFALEVFDDSLPVDLYRTMTPGEVFPVTPCLPQNCTLTAVSPCVTAEFTKDEFQHPWCSLTSDNISVHGLSLFSQASEDLFCMDSTVSRTSDQWNPFLRVQKKKGVYRIPLPVFESQANHIKNSKNRLDDKIGILVTSVSHEGCCLAKGKDNMQGAPAQKGDATHQRGLFRFVLKKGTNLKRHGIAAVFDNCGDSDHHWSGPDQFCTHHAPPEVERGLPSTQDKRRQ